MSTAVGSSSCAWTCEHGGCEPPFNRKEITGTHEFSCVPVAVPVRGAGCIQNIAEEMDIDNMVAVPVRGAGCILIAMEKNGFW